MRRRSVLAGGVGVAGAALPGAGALLAGCADTMPAQPPSSWLGASHERGHRLRTLRSGALPAATVQRRCDVLIVGAGIAGLAAARALQRAGVQDLALLELEDGAGGNSRATQLAGLRCPLGAHYLPVPGAQADVVAEWLHELGLLRHRLGRTEADERHLCHSPQERLFFDGSWMEGLLPPAEAGSATMGQYRAMSAAMARVQRELAFSMPSTVAPWTPGHAALDAISFAAWLNQEGLHDARLRWYLDYVCRDDYGAGIAQVSAWAGLHYFASRGGFHAPGEDVADHEPVFTWPEGNAWLADRLAASLAGRVHGGRVVGRVAVQRQGVQALAWAAGSNEVEAWSARAVVMAVPLFVAARLLAEPPSALAEVVARQPQAPWLVSNLALREPLLDRGIGAAPAWDNVAYGSASLGYVDAGHQRLSPLPGPTVITHYWALPQAERGALLNASAESWAARVMAELQPLHPDLAHKTERIALMRYGHAMSVPVPGLRGSPALAALAMLRGPLQFAHADLSAYSVFEEAFTHGDRAGRGLAAWLRRG